MKKHINYILLEFCFLLLLCQCSTKQNTSLSRGYQDFATRYNVYFNANESYKKGIEKINKKGKDNYSDILPIYPISKHENATVATAEMDICIEKCQKAIKTHSIKKKPKKDSKKSKDPKYEAFLKKEEYNGMIEQSWVLLGKAQFHKADFLAAGSSFTYAIRHYSDNTTLCTEANIWLARCYAEMSWFYEAENILNKLNDKSFTSGTTQLFVFTKADLLLKEKQYDEAIPFLETALHSTNKKTEKARIAFILGQLYELNNRYDKAFESYSLVIKQNPPYEMAFNATLKKAQSYQGADNKKILKQLNNFAKDPKNKKYLDQIYCAIAKLYQRNGKKELAIENYKLAIKKSTHNGVEKAEALLSLGKIYYDDRKYLLAQPLYNEALPLISRDYDNYKELKKLADNLNDLATNYNTVVLQDSLQMLSQLSEAERVEKIKKVIAEKEKEKEEIKKKTEEDARLQEIETESSVPVIPGLALGESSDKSWYFYNPTLVAKGKIEFQRKWGQRALEDNWRRKNKASLNQEVQETEQNTDSTNIADTTAIGEKATKKKVLTDKDVEYYLQQIPFTEAQKEASNKLIEESLYNLFLIYEEKLQNYPLAEETFGELEHRFPKFKQMPDAMFHAYQLYLRTENTAKAEEYKQKIIANFPESKYAIVLKNPDALNEMNELRSKEESLYQETYTAFLKNDFNKVLTNSQIAQKELPFSKLLPKFLFLEALTTGKKEGKEKFKEKMEELVKTYPTSEVTPMARDMIALINQGQEILSTPSNGNLLAQRETIVSEEKFAENIAKAGFKYEPETKHIFVLLIQGSEDEKNSMVFEIASYNFTRFMIKDFDMQVRKLDEKLYAIAVMGLENLAEAAWYQKSVLGNNSIQETLKGINYKGFVISEANFKGVFDKETLQKYLQFYINNNLEVKEPDVVKKLEEESGFVKGEK